MLHQKSASHLPPSPHFPQLPCSALPLLRSTTVRCWVLLRPSFLDPQLGSVAKPGFPNKNDDIPRRRFHRAPSFPTPPFPFPQFRIQYIYIQYYAKKPSLYYHCALRLLPFFGYIYIYRLSFFHGYRKRAIASQQNNPTTIPLPISV